MRTVLNLNELIANIRLLDKYLNSRADPEYSFALALVKKGTCFMVVKENNNYRFYPSRFIGYANNVMAAHLNNENKDGKETNPVISKIIGSKPIANPILDNLYRNYCESLGFIANDKGTFGVQRKYWEAYTIPLK